MLKTILICGAIIFLLVVILYFSIKKIKKQVIEIKALKQKDSMIHEQNKLKEKIDIGSNAEQFANTLDVLQKLRKTNN